MQEDWVVSFIYLAFKSANNFPSLCLFDDYFHWDIEFEFAFFPLSLNNTLILLLLRRED